MHQMASARNSPGFETLFVGTNQGGVVTTPDAELKRDRLDAALRSIRSLTWRPARLGVNLLAPHRTAPKARANPLGMLEQWTECAGLVALIFDTNMRMDYASEYRTSLGGGSHACTRKSHVLVRRIHADMAIQRGSAEPVLRDCYRR